MTACFIQKIYMNFSLFLARPDRPVLTSSTVVVNKKGAWSHWRLRLQQKIAPRCVPKLSRFPMAVVFHSTHSAVATIRSEMCRFLRWLGSDVLVDSTASLALVIICSD